MIHSPSRDQDDSQPLFDLRSTLSVLRAQWITVLACATGFLSVAFVYILVAVPTYTAKAVVLVDPREAQTMEANSVLPGIGNDSAAIASQVSVIQSREVLESVFAAEHIAHDPEFTAAGMLSNLVAAITGAKRPINEATTFDKFARRLRVEREGLTYIINVSFSSSDASKAARIANAIVQEYTSDLQHEKASANAEVTDLLTNRISGLQQAVSNAERAVEDYKVRYHIFDAGSGTTLTQMRIDQVTSQLLVAQDAERQAQTAYEQALAVGTSPAGLERLTQIVSSPAAETLRVDYNARLAAMASAQATLGPRHPTMISQQAELTRVERSIIAEAQRITSELRARAEAATNNVVKLESDLESLRAISNDANQRAVELRQLERDAEAKRSVLDQFMTRSQETGQLESMQLSNARLISPAHPPSEPVWPRPALLLALAGFVGLSVGVVLALFLGSPRGNVALASMKFREVSTVPAPRGDAPLSKAPQGRGFTAHKQRTNRYAELT